MLLSAVVAAAASAAENEMREKLLASNQIDEECDAATILRNCEFCAGTTVALASCLAIYYYCIIS